MPQANGKLTARCVRDQSIYLCKYLLPTPWNSWHGWDLLDRFYLRGSGLGSV